MAHSHGKKKTSKRSSGGSKLPALSLLVTRPKKQLQAGVKRYETALEMKSMPGLFMTSGKRRTSGPKLPKGFKRVKRQKLPKRIAHLFP